MNLICKIISGGQTGADRGALQAAMDCGVRHGGWCPKGRMAEDGSIPGRFMLKETKETDHRVRTEKNIVDSHGTLIFCYGTPRGGTALTLDLCRKHEKPFFLIDLASEDDLHLAASIQTFVSSLSGRKPKYILNVAGSRESVNPGIYQRTYQIMHTFLTNQQAAAKNSFSKKFLILTPLLWTTLIAVIAARVEAQTESLITLTSWTFALIACLFHMPLFFQPRFRLLNEIRILILLLIFWLTKNMFTGGSNLSADDSLYTNAAGGLTVSFCNPALCALLLTAGLLAYLLTYRQSNRPLLLDPPA